MQFEYSAFIITYKRVDDLSNTIQALRNQTMPPLKILIIDNDPGFSAKPIALAMNCSYHGDGINKGPSGAAYYGLKFLFEDGASWVLWVDDNDPPIFYDSIEKIINLNLQIEDLRNVGMIGCVGTYFNPFLAKTVRVRDDAAVGIISVDHIAGNMMPLVNIEVYKSNIFPEKKLFFGFEELCFCLRIKRSGFKIIISGEELIRYRKNSNRIGFKRKNINYESIENVWRHYYSVRNLLYILLYEEKNYFGSLYFIIKMVIKSAIVLHKEWKYARIYIRTIYLGLYDAICKNFPKRFLPV